MILITTLFVGCSSDNPSTRNFGSQAEADAAVASSQAQIQLAVNDVMNLSSTAASFGLTKTTAYAYDASTGWWRNTSMSSSGGYTYHYDYQHRFTPRNTDGTPTSETNQFEYKYDYDFSGSTSGLTYELTYASDYSCTGLSGYRAGTGDLVVNGSSDISYDWGGDYAGQTIKYQYDYSNDYRGVTFSPDVQYPTSGIINFTSTFNYDPNNDYLPDYHVSGKISFNGDNTATLEFGGYLYLINLTTGSITPAGGQ